MPVYLVLAGQHVKIGFSNSVHTRLTKMQTDVADTLSLLRILDGDEALEAALHARFKHLHHRGEWFRYSDEMLGDLGAPDLSLSRPPHIWSSEPRKEWSAEARARQSAVQLAHFADPVKGAERRRKMRETQIAQMQIRSVRELAVKAGGWGRFAAALGLAPEVVVSWHGIPPAYLEAAATAARLPVEKLLHLKADLFTEPAA